MHATALLQPSEALSGAPNTKICHAPHNRQVLSMRMLQRRFMHALLGACQCVAVTKDSERQQHLVLWRCQAPADTRQSVRCGRAAWPIDKHCLSQVVCNIPHSCSHTLRTALPAATLRKCCGSGSRGWLTARYAHLIECHLEGHRLTRDTWSHLEQRHLALQIRGLTRGWRFTVTERVPICQHAARVAVV